MNILEFFAFNPLTYLIISILLVFFLIFYRIYLGPWLLIRKGKEINTKESKKEKDSNYLDKLWLNFWKYIRIPNSQTGKPDSLLTVAFYVTFILMSKYFISGLEVEINGFKFIFANADTVITTTIMTMIWGSYFGKRWMDCKFNGNSSQLKERD